MNSENKIGYWKTDSCDLPVFEYTGDLPYNHFLSNGTKVKLPYDPWFLLGNYQITIFAHVSGEYELISGQRTWARLNQGEKLNSGKNTAKIIIDGKEFSLVGMDSLSAKSSTSKRSFGIGYAEYTYLINGLKINRKLSVKPSFDVRNGSSALVLDVFLENQSDKPINFEYFESIFVNYKEIQYQNINKNQLKVKYTYENYTEREQSLAGIKIYATSEDSLLAKDRTQISLFDLFPPEIFMKSLENFEVKSEDQEISGNKKGILAPNENISLKMIFGFSFEQNFSNKVYIFNDLKTYNSEKGFLTDWKKNLPSFESEKDIELKNELIWHAYNLEAMATYSEFYNETKIPQGTIYDYSWGIHASARDNFQHALPLVYYNPKLAKSVIKYMLQRTTAFGDIRLIEKGVGYAEHERYFTSDQQLYFLLFFTEYLRVTKDYEILKEKIAPYPVLNQNKMTVLKFLEQIFVFLRDTVNVGSHGLVRLLNSDWNDTVYYVLKVPFSTVVLDGESHMNSAMAISILQRLIPILDQIKELKKFCDEAYDLKLLSQSMSTYRKSILNAFLKDLGTRTFPRRMYFAGKAYGEDNMFLEPQGFTLQIEEISHSQKISLYNEMKKRVYNGEKLGAREQENPEFDDPHYDKGSRENGGFWYALNGPVIVAMKDIDKKEAKKLFENITFNKYAKAFPDYWTSYWSAADNIESSLIPEEGLPDQSESYSDIPIYCAHPHAWILYCYYKLNDN